MRPEAKSAPKPAPDETGAALILVLAFMIVAGLIVGGLTSAVVNDLGNTAKFASARSVQYAATSATDLAIQSIRYSPLLSIGPSSTLNASPPTSCWGTGSSPSSNYTDGRNQIAVWCSTVWTPTSANTRLVTLSACLSTVSPAACALSPLVRAAVTFGDYPSGLNPPTAALCVVYCGSSIVVNSFVSSSSRSAPVPTVTGVTLASSSAAASGPVTGGTSVTITGTGFVVGGTTVDFVEESGLFPDSANIVLPVTAGTVTVSSSTTITAPSPSVIAGTTYFVTVTTPSGTSAYGTTTDVFTYTPVTPTVLGLTPGLGYIAGGSAVAIRGTGFVAGARVNFVGESGGTAVGPPVIVPATDVTVLTNSSITAVSPAVTVGTTYYVTVTTPAGTSASTSSIFTYQPLVPVVAAILPSSGPPGTGVTITGSGFVSGATVAFVAESGGIAGTVTVPASSTTVTSASSITAVSPSTTAKTTYFVTVTTPSGSSYYPVFTGT